MFVCFVGLFFMLLWVCTCDCCFVFANVWFASLICVTTAVFGVVFPLMVLDTVFGFYAVVRFVCNVLVLLWIMFSC